MAQGIAYILTLLSILPYTLKVNEEPDLSTQTLLRQREAEQAELTQQMARLQEQLELERLELERLEPRGPQEAEPPALWQHGGWWAAADTLLLLLGLLWRRRKRGAAPGSGSQQGSSGAAEQQQEQRGGTARQRHAQPHAASSPLFGCRCIPEEGGDGRTFSRRFPRTT